MNRTLSCLVALGLASVHRGESRAINAVVNVVVREVFDNLRIVGKV